MTIKIEHGKCYRARDGRKVGPMVRVRVPSRYSREWTWTDDPTGRAALSRGSLLWRDDGVESAWGKPSQHDLVAEWIDEPTLWRDMTPEQRGALLLAHHEGKVIQFWRADPGEWVDDADVIWLNARAYRVKPEPTRQMVTWVSRTRAYHITFETTDDVPDPTTVKFHAI